MRRPPLCLALLLLASAACVPAALGQADAPALSPEDESAVARWRALPEGDRARIDAILATVPKPADLPPLAATQPCAVRAAVLALAREGRNAVDGLVARRVASLSDLRQASLWDSLAEMTLREARILSACRIATGWEPPKDFPEEFLPRDALQGIRQAPAEILRPEEARSLRAAFNGLHSGNAEKGAADGLLKAKGARWVLECEARGADPARAASASALLSRIYAPEFERAAREEVSPDQEQAEKADAATFPLLYYPGALLPHKPVYLGKRMFYMRDLAFYAGPAATGILSDAKALLDARTRASRALVAAGVLKALEPIKRWRDALSPKKDADLWRELSIALWLLNDSSGLEALKARYEKGAKERRDAPLASELQTIPFLIPQLESGDEETARLANEALEARTGRKAGAVEPRKGETQAEALGRDWREWWEKNKPNFDVDDDELSTLRGILENIDPSMQSDRERAGK